MFRWLRGRTPQPINPELWRDIRAGVPWAAALDPERDARLALLAARFLHEKTITPIGELVIEERDRGLLAAACCLPLPPLAMSQQRYCYRLRYLLRFVVPVLLS